MVIRVMLVILGLAAVGPSSMVAQAQSEIAPQDRSATAVPASESEVFERARRSVFVVETESGHGSGFLVHQSGLILTNDHVLGRSRYVAVGVDRAHKYKALVLARDAARDLAIVQVHPDAVAGVAPLSLIAPEGSPAGRVAVGERVLAIASLRTVDGVTLTSGIVSRVGPDEIVADINVNAGGSGGPLLNLRGEVLGINTYLRKTAVGPGLAGVVRAHLAQPLLAATICSPSSPPPAEQLPHAPPTRYPPGPLREVASSIQSPALYRKTVGGMHIEVLTPPLLFYLLHQDEIRETRATRGPTRAATAVRPLGDAYHWRRDVGQLEAIVGFRITAGTFSAPPRSARPGELAPPRAVTRFKKDFQQMRLFRDGMEVTPIVPGRFCQAPGPVDDPTNPAGCFGLYRYRPEAFAPGAILEVHVYIEDAPTKPIVWKMPSALLSRIHIDFEAYFETQNASRHQK